MLKRFTFLLFGVAFALLITLLSTKAFAVGPTFTITNVKNECNGDAGGSFDIKVTAATGTTLIFNIFGPGPPFTDISNEIVTGVTLPYTYHVTGAEAGSYIIIVKDIIAAPPQLQTIVSYSPISISAQTITDNTVCGASAGAINITVTGGSGTYNYLWSNSAITEDISGLTSGTYTVTITDPNSSCLLSQSFQVKDPQPVDFAISTSTPALCTGGNIIINAGQPTASGPGEAGVSYQLRVNGSNPVPSIPPIVGDGATNLVFTLPTSSYVSGQTIDVVATLTPCMAKVSGNSLTVTVNANNTVSVASSAPTVCVNTALSPTITHTTTGATGIANDNVPGMNGLPAGVSAHWSGNTITISGTPSTAAGSPFNYSILLTGGCGSVSATGTITVNSLPVVSAPSASLCIGGTMTLSPIAGGTWVSSDPTKATVTNAGLVTGVSVGSVTFTFTNTATTCSNTTSSVTINALPVVSTPSASLCIGQYADLVSYIWRDLGKQQSDQSYSDQRRGGDRDSIGECYVHLYRCGDHL